MATSSNPLMECPAPRPMIMDRRWRANIDPAPNCPRCASSNTKFCYYNNYSLSQPRFFCKGCRRYWTRGGSLRSVPVGGGCRKSRRSRSTRSIPAAGSTNMLGSLNDQSPNSGSNSSESGGPDIDMAAVFARYLNNDQRNVSEEINNDPTNTSSETSHDSLGSSSYGLENGFESKKLSDDILDQEFQMIEGFVPSDVKQLGEEGTIEGFLNPDFHSFDDILDDVFWSEDSNFSSLTWHPDSQSQDFETQTLPPVDQSNVSTSQFSCDNWSYFDNTGYEVFSRP